jgi:hypothetical protein
MVALAQVYGKGQLSFGFGILHLLFMTSNSGLLLPQLERRFGNLFGLKKSSHANVTYPLATVDNKKVQMKDQQRPTCTCVSRPTNSCIQP